MAWGQMYGFLKFKMGSTEGSMNPTSLKILSDLFCQELKYTKCVPLLYDILHSLNPWGFTHSFSGER